MKQTDKEEIIETVKQWFRDNISYESVYEAESMLGDDGTTGTVGYELMACHLESDLDVDLDCDDKEDVIALSKTWLLENVYLSNTVKYNFDRRTIGFAVMMGDLEKYLNDNMKQWI